jgi:protein tyrosine phosphatase (PTP) superfamily phosphohydrolase (DUF442 family)
LAKLRNDKIPKTRYSKNMKIKSIFAETLLYGRSLWQILKSRLRSKIGVEDILNYCYISNKLTTSGQPTAQELSLIKRLGFSTVLNLAPSNAANALPDEQAIVTALGMEYVNIPVDWGNPTVDDFSQFCTVMNAHQDQQIYVHCAMNMRVSVFVYLYRYLILGVPESEAYQSVMTIWQPNETWQKFIKTTIAALADV